MKQVEGHSNIFRSSHPSVGEDSITVIGRELIVLTQGSSSVALLLEADDAQRLAVVLQLPPVFISDPVGVGSMRVQYTQLWSPNKEGISLSAGDLSVFIEGQNIEHLIHAVIGSRVKTWGSGSISEGE